MRTARSTLDANLFVAIGSGDQLASRNMAEKSSHVAG
jgi:hypothetical protein